MAKALAFYLPQYHEIPENNEWWGQGFTEWTNLRKAKPLFRGHVIDKPLDDRYYDLMDRKTVEWQTALMEEYGMHGLIYYHYWFNGRKILEKPAENLLEWKDVNQRFMFMWANHDWTRSWVGGKETLLKLDYGEPEDWEKHADYLMRFFLDRRYLKKDNKPMFQIYLRQRIPRFEEMISVWDKKCRENGFDGIYIIDNVDYGMVRQGNLSPACDAYSLQEHYSSMQYYERKHLLSRLVNGIGRRLDAAAKRISTGAAPIEPLRVKRYDYGKLARSSVELMRELRGDKRIIYQACTGWDNTPRYGKRGYVVRATPGEFKEYIKAANDLSDADGREYVIIACWNEWCEGMVLEPTQADGYAYLEALREVFAGRGGKP